MLLLLHWCSINLPKVTDSLTYPPTFQPSSSFLEESVSHPRDWKWPSSLAALRTGACDTMLVPFLWKVLIFVVVDIVGSSLGWNQTPTFVFPAVGVHLKSLFSSFSLAGLLRAFPRHTQLRAQPEIWAEFLCRMWGSPLSGALLSKMFLFVFLLLWSLWTLSLASSTSKIVDFCARKS